MNSGSLKRPVVGLLLEDLSGVFQNGAWPGILDAVRKHDAHLLCFNGGSLLRSSEDDPYTAQRNILYEIAGEMGLDGLLVIGCIGSYVTQEMVDSFLSAYTHIPTVSLVAMSDRLPFVEVDNQAGVRALIDHLVTAHSYRRYACVRGPEGNREADERLAAFHKALDVAGIPLSDRFVFDGQFDAESGALAVQTILERKIDVDVIVCADDETCLGALDELKRNGVHVPEDIALVGFDDIEESRFVTPPLTTVRQPLDEMGSLAVERLFALMQGEKVASEHVMPRMQVRQSCGCFDLADRRSETSASAPMPSSVSFEQCHDELLLIAMRWVDESCRRHVSEIVGAFCSEVNGGDGGRFVQTVDRVGRRMLDTGHDLRTLHNVFFELWYYALPKLDKKAFSAADDALQRARVVLGEIIERNQGLKRIQAIKDNYELHSIGETLSNTLDRDELFDTMCEELSGIGAVTFYVTLFDDEPGRYSQKSRLVLSLENGVRQQLPDNGIPFDTDKLVPEGFLSTPRAHAIIVEPLFFQDEMYGTILFESDLRDGNVYEILREYISNSMHFANLIGTIQRQSDSLIVANRELEVLRQKDLAYIDSVNMELELGKKIQMGFLPENLPNVDKWELVRYFKPARKVSGDFYDIFPVADDQYAFIIADVSGKDVSAALFMALIRTLLRVFAEQAQEAGKTPLHAVDVVNNYVVRNHQSRDGDGRCMFATLFFGIFKVSTGDINYVNAGHNPPHIIRASGLIEKIKATGPAVGFMENIFFREGHIQLAPGETLFLYTDGVTEAVGSNAEFYTNERLMNLVSIPTATAQGLVDAIVDDLDAHVGDSDASDDITMLALRRKQ